MLLARTAENVYWAARYLERAEATARLVEAHTRLFLDLPAAAGVSWAPLLYVTGTADDLADRGEDAVVRFLTVDAEHVGSVRSCLVRARLNVRLARSVLPEAAWEELNSLHLWVEEHLADAIDRRTRPSWTTAVIRRCQMLAGLLQGVMSHDEAWSFLEVGRHLERADTTTRVMDVQAGVILDDPLSGVLPYADVTWASVLRSLSAHQMFMRASRTGVSGPEALRFLLRNPQFPRSVEHCLTAVSRSLLELGWLRDGFAAPQLRSIAAVPSYDAPMAACAAVQELLLDAEIEGNDLHVLMDRVQLGIGRVHDAVADTYFTAAPSRSAAFAAST